MSEQTPAGSPPPVPPAPPAQTPPPAGAPPGGQPPPQQIAPRPPEPPPPPPAKPRTTLYALIGAAVVLVLLVAGLAVYFGGKPAPVAQAPVPVAPVTPAPPAAPQFDVVRVDTSGNTVIAGRAAPGATVTIKTGTTILGTAKADASGAFVFLPTSPLPQGAQELSLTETLPDGQVIVGSQTASVDVAADGTLTVLSGPNGSKVLSGQGPKAGVLGLGTVDYDADGHAIFSGTAPAGSSVTVTLNNTTLGTATAGTDGHWSLTTSVPKNSGTVTLSATDANGAVVPKVTAPFALETLPDALAEGHVIIAKGDNLWVIARHVYGKGTLYTLIYQANASQIHDPNLIFPGQAFALPKPK